MTWFRGLDFRFFAFSLFILFALGCSTPQSLSSKNLNILPNDKLEMEIKTEVQNFIQASEPDRLVGSPGHEKARRYLVEKFFNIASLAQKVKTNARVVEIPFRLDTDFAARGYQKDFDTRIKPKFKPSDAAYKKWDRFTRETIAFTQKFKGVPGDNIILEIPGTKYPGEVLYVGAHYDTIIHNFQTLQAIANAPAPGADDNASALAVLIEVAKIVAVSHPDRTIRFVAFDAEELFFLGSHDLAQRLSAQDPRATQAGEKIVGLINLEMLGWSTLFPGKPAAIKVYMRDARNLGGQSDLEIGQFISSSAALLKSPLKVELVPNNFDRSDNWSFWQKSFSAVCVSQDWEKDFDRKNYHTSQDIPANLNYPYLTAATEILNEALLQLSIHSLQSLSF